MANLIDIIVDTFPADEDVGVPLLSTITVLFDREMDETSLDEKFFVEGPDTDQFIGPGLALLEFPSNTSQGDIDDFLRSPGYKGIVQGVTTFANIDPTDPDITVSGSPYRTKLIFTATLPFTPLTEYTAMLSSVDDLVGNTLSGIVTFSFQSGSGSIQTVPSDISTSVLKTTLQSSSLTTATALAVIKTNPVDHTVQNAVSIREITVDFNLPIDITSVNNDSVIVVTEPATDHPNISVTSLGNLATTVTVVGNRLIINI